jgi:hypothetical protein
VELNGIKVLSLDALVELKLASGMSAEHRLRDLADVQELAKYVQLPQDFAGKLDPYVRSKFVELCGNVLPRDVEAEQVGEQPQE